MKDESRGAIAAAFFLLLISFILHPSSFILLFGEFS
jgi:hypothetical protein